MNRYRTSKKARYDFYIRDFDRYELLVTKHFAQIEIINKLDRLDRAMLCKLSHFIEYYIIPILKMAKPLKYISSQLVLVLLITVVEASIGPKSKKKSDTLKRLTTFYKHNLDSKSKEIVTRSFRYYKTHKYMTLERTIKELYNLRNAFVHSADLANIKNDQDSLYWVTYSKGKKNRKGQIIYKYLDTEQIYLVTKVALNNYFLKRPNNRVPRQVYL